MGRINKENLNSQKWDTIWEKSARWDLFIYLELELYQFFTASSLKPSPIDFDYMIKNRDYLHKSKIKIKKLH